MKERKIENVENTLGSDSGMDHHKRMASPRAEDGEEQETKGVRKLLFIVSKWCKPIEHLGSRTCRSSAHSLPWNSSSGRKYGTDYIGSKGSGSRIRTG